MLFFGLLVLGVTLAVLALIPRTQKALSRHRRLATMLSLVYVAFLFLHPYIFGLPGRIAEARFQSEIRLGMSRSEIQGAAQAYGARGLLGSPLYAQRSDGILIVSFVDWSTFCIAGGKEYDFYFRPDWTLTQWKTRRWENAC